MSNHLQIIDLSQTGRAFNRFFQEGIGSCHAYLTLRDDWREHARLVQREIGFRSVRAHGIFHELVGIYQVWPKACYIFTNLDKIYDCAGELHLAHHLPPNSVVYYEVERT